MLTKFRQILYRQQPKSADLMMGIISFLFAWSAFLTRNVESRSPVVKALEDVAPLMFWTTLLAIYGIAIVLATIFNHSLLVVVGSGLGTFTWGAINGVLLFSVPFQARLMLALAVYLVFFVFSAWSFINSQEVHRLTKKFGPNYHRVIEEDMLKEIIELRKRVLVATIAIDVAEEERQHIDVE